MKTFLRVVTIFIAFLLLNAGELHAQTIEFPSNGCAVRIGDLDVPGAQITVEALVYMEANTLAGNVVSKHLNPSNVNYLLRPGSFELTAYQKGSNGATHFIRINNPVKLAVNRWYHIAGTYDGERVKYYVDGCLVKDTAFSGNLFQNNEMTVIGNRGVCQCEQFLGRLDEVRIWKVARTQNEIARNMLALPRPANQYGLLACYSFDGNYDNSQGDPQWNGVQTGVPAFYPPGAAIQAFEVTGLQTADADCNKVNNGSITVTSNRIDALYSIDGLNFQSAGVFPAIKPGNYTVLAKDPDACIIKTNAVVGSRQEIVPISVTASLCRQGSYGGHDSAGVYVDTIPARTGCDTLRTLILTDNRPPVRKETHTICEGESYQGHVKTGAYADTMAAANGCDSIHVLQLTVLNKPQPNLGDTQMLCNGDSIRLFPGNYNSYLWQDGSSADHLTVKQAGIYAVVVGNSCGTRQAQVVITEGPCGLFFPTAFSPNNDGVNDVFRPVARQADNLQWRIYNRFGQLLFEVNAASKSWDGRVNGQLQPAGVYVWLCTYTRNGKTVAKKGSFVLIR